MEARSVYFCLMYEKKKCLAFLQVIKICACRVKVISSSRVSLERLVCSVILFIC